MSSAQPQNIPNAMRQSNLTKLFGVANSNCREGGDPTVAAKKKTRSGRVEERRRKSRSANFSGNRDASFSGQSYQSHADSTNFSGNSG